MGARVCVCARVRACVRVPGLIVQERRPVEEREHRALHVLRPAAHEAYEQAERLRTAVVLLVSAPMAWN